MKGSRFHGLHGDHQRGDKVGALEETITVSGASPLVDVQSVTKQTVLTREMLDALPTPRSIRGRDG